MAGGGFEFDKFPGEIFYVQWEGRVSAFRHSSFEPGKPSHRPDR
jgi:hypothetical protein